MQASVVFACYDTSSLIRRGASQGEAAIKNNMSQLYYGDDTYEAPVTDFIVFEDQLILELKFRDCTHSQFRKVQRANREKLTVDSQSFTSSKESPCLCWWRFNREEVIQKTLHATDKKILGRTLHGMVKTVLKNCKNDGHGKRKRLAIQGRQ